MPMHPSHARDGVTGAALALIALAACTAQPPAPTERVTGSATVPSGFVDERFADGLSFPTAMTFAPDGRIFVCEQGGRLRVIKNGVTLAQPFVTVTVDSVGERGLLGVAVDPNFATNRFVYVYYTATTPAVHNRVSRFTANGDVAVAGSETIILELDNLSTASNHNGGAIHFGPDGKLYVGVGENANGAHSQTLNNLLGKMLRIDPNGNIPTDNPFFGSAIGKNRAIWALGLRNPFTFAFQPGTGRLFINDVGERTWEEIDEGVAGANYGWPTTEGATSDPRFRTPFYAYNQAGNGCAITGGAFYNPATVQFPSSYVGKYFFADGCGQWIRMIDTTTKVVSDFAGAVRTVDLKVGADGALYYLFRDFGYVGRIRFASGGGQAPVITQHPASVTRGAGQSASFSVSASGTQPLSFQWQRNGSDIAGATAATYTISSVAAGDNGAQFRARVTNSLGSATSNAATLTVTSNRPPTASITTPTAGSLYSAGQSISYSAMASDAEDGSLPASAYSWTVVFHHDEHTHPFLDNINGVTGGSFVVPDRGETSTNVWYRIHLTVRDSGGLVTTVFRDISPRVVNLTLQTNPAGLQVTMDGIPVTAPATIGSVVGMVRALGATTPQSLNGTSYQFSSWSDGGANPHEVVTPTASATYTATFQAGAPPPPPPPSTWTSQDIGSVGVTGSWSQSNGVHTIKGAGADIWGTTDSFRFTHQQVTGDFVITARVTALQRTHDFAKAGVMARASLAGNAVNVHSLVSPIASSKFRFIKRTSTGGTSSVEPGPDSPLPGAPGWVRLERIGNVFRASTSLNGSTFNRMGTDQVVSMPATLYVGMAVTSHVAGTLTTATFDNVSITGAAMPPPPMPPAPPGDLQATAGSGQVSLAWSSSTGATSYTVKRSTVSGSSYATVQAGITGNSYTNTGLTNGTTYYYVVTASNSAGESGPSNQASATPTAAAPPPPPSWSSQDVGSVSAIGSWSEASGTYTVRGSGADIYGTADGFRYVYQSISGNATITARVTSIQNVNTWSKAGLMIRNGLSAGAPNVMMVVSPTDANGYRWQVRSGTGGTTSSTKGGAGSRPVWFRIIRNGNTLTGHYSSNGTTWTQLGTVTLTWPSTVQIGLAVTSHANGSLANGVFDNVTITTP